MARADVRQVARIGIRLAALLAAGCGEGTAPSDPSIRGSWTIAGYTDAGVAGVTTGTMTFLSNGQFSARGTVTYPGEPVDSLSTDGTWAQYGTRVDLTVAGNTTPWQIRGTADSVDLLLMGPAPPTFITLTR